MVQLNGTAQEISAQLDDGSLTAEALMQATLERIAATNGSVNAVVSLRDADALMAEARAVDQTPRIGWMHGLPIAIKDLANVKGLRTTMGSPLFADIVAAEDDEMVARIRAAGAIIIGKTNTPEFGFGSHTFNPVHGATCNPYDLARSAGGSSGGAAAALACGMLPIADGSDMMGSLRNPAGWNNVYGFRPSWGRVPGEAAGDSFLHQLATNGPMARSPQDLAAMLDVISGPNPKVPLCMPKTDYAGQLQADLKGKRIGWLGDWGGAYPMEPGLLDKSEEALRVLEGLGCRVEPVAAPFDAAKIWQAWVALRSWCTAGNLAPLYDDPEKRKGLKPAAIWETETGLAQSGQDVHRASVIRSEWYRKAAELFETYDALVLPSAQVWPFPVDWVSPTEIAGTQMDTYHRWMEVVIPVSLLGLPCVNLPAGFGETGLPAGIQVFGRSGADLEMLQIAEQYHAETNWPQRRPPPMITG